MRENRTYGSEGGEANNLPDPYREKSAGEMPYAMPLHCPVGVSIQPRLAARRHLAGESPTIWRKARVKAG
jgi:hypothetical protein